MMTTAPLQEFVLSLSCDDQVGIVAALTTELAAHKCNITESAQFWDRGSNRFFMRIGFTTPADLNRDGVERALQPIIDRFSMKTRLLDRSVKPRIIIMVSKFDHAMLHLLYQIRVGWLNAEVAAIVSNHDTAARIADYEQVPFHHWPVTRDNKDEQEARLLDLVRETGADLVILARYMQILSNDLSNRLFGKIINIHHSFLPSFKGAKPYHQAHKRGVKLIGATAHYVTPDLDEGPIIEQETARVDHAGTAEDFAAQGRDIEALVLSRAVKLHLEGRVMLNGGNTVVFD